jgi:hypothetical protein
MIKGWLCSMQDIAGFKINVLYEGNGKDDRINKKRAE